MKRISILLTTLCAALPLFAQKGAQFDGELWQDQPLPGWESETAARIDRMGHTTAETLAPMSKCYHVKEAMFEEGEEIQGIPYSGVHDFCGYVGKDISFYTYLSAMNNVQSSMYLVNYHLPPWDRLRAGPFYGTVCSATATYVWGMPIMLFTREIREGRSCYLEDVGDDIDSLQLFDGYCYAPRGAGGHIVIICGIGRDQSGKVQKIDTFEGTGPYNKYRSYSREDFQEKQIDRYQGHFYRYDHEKWGSLVSLAPFIEQQIGPDYKFNTDLSPEDGERLTYPAGKTVKIDILSKKYKSLEIVKDGQPYASLPAEKGVSELKDLPEGLYTAWLESPKKQSRPIEFQVAQSGCKVWYEDGQLYVGGCRDGVYPQGAYTTPGGKAGKGSFSTARFCIPAGEGRWAVTPNIPEGSVEVIKVNLAGRYSGYWAKTVTFKTEQ